jgi:acetolactate synthase-1/2/3 large subunit
MQDTDTPTRADVPLNGAQLFADTVAALGWRHVFHIPGEGILEMVDALARRHPQVRQVSFRHEAGMVYAAQALGQQLGRPALCLAARAPGALNTTLALHTADTDAAPLVMVIGQAPLAQAGRDPLSGPDLGEVFRPLVKEVLQVTEAQRIPEMLARAWQRAASGRMGPVVVLIPEDLMHQPATPLAFATPAALPRAGVAPADLDTLRAWVAQARRPLLLAGGSGWSDGALAALRGFTQRQGWPLACAYRRGHLFDNTDPHYAGELGIGIDPALYEAVEAADLVIAINLRLGELNTFGPGGFGGFKLLAPRPGRRLVHLHPAATELQRAMPADLPVACGPDEALWALESLPTATPEPGWLARCRAARQAWTTSGHCPGPLNLREVFTALRQTLPPETVLTVGAGAYAVWLHRYFDLLSPRSLLGPKSGAMGYGLPAAIGAALAEPGRPVVAVAGDGCLMMHPEELATAVQERLDLLVLVIDNQGYGAIRASQQRLFGQAVGTDLHNPDFVAFARAFGALAERVERTEDWQPTLQRLWHAKGVRLIHLVMPASVSKPQ